MKNNSFGNNFKLGLLGGGQLGRMLIQEALNYDIQIHSLDSDENAPCKNCATSFTLGSLNDFDTVYNFGKDKDVITIEIENVNCEALLKLESEGKKVFPQAKIIQLIKDKGLQKQFYQNNNIPTANFRLITNQEELTKHEDFLPFVQKMRTGGYDGKGVQSIKSKNDFEKGFDVPSVLEQFVDFEKEIAVIVSRNQNGEILAFPAVECEFSPTLNLVEFLFSPANISIEIEEKAKKIAKKIIEKLEMVGVLAVEFFLTKNGELLVNEIAPRPHNSGHHTIECNLSSQFDQHLRSIMNLPLGSCETVQAGVMINLLGEANFQGEPIYDGLEEVLAIPGVKVHIYGKNKTKPFRKMGHVTIVNPNLEKAKNLARKIQNTLRVIS
jgi:5-(carboxyamino)imidazole ribonucleotide synthase